MTKWRTIMGREVSREASLPGIWKCREPGNWFIRARKKCDRTGKLKEVKCIVEARTAKQAWQILQEKLDELLGKANEPGMTFKEYAEDLLQRKLTLGEIRSRCGEAKWSGVIRNHLAPAFEDILIHQLARQDIADWRLSQAALVQEGKLAPGTFNGRLSILKVITATAEVEFDIANPCRGIKPLPNTRRTYTRESPNSLPAEKVKEFLALAKKKYPACYAAMYLGFATGLRPSSIRPLRRRGKESDVIWDEGILLVRRSHTMGQTIMEATKTGKDVVIHLPDEVIEVLRWHTQTIIQGTRQQFSELLFPAKDGRLHSQTWLKKPFIALSKELKLGYTVTPRAMRRTFQNLAREARVNDFVTRSISGHQTEAMQEHYSTISGEEQRDAVGQVARLFG